MYINCYARTKAKLTNGCLSWNVSSFFCFFSLFHSKFFKFSEQRLSAQNSVQTRDHESERSRGASKESEKDREGRALLKNFSENFGTQRFSSSSNYFESERRFFSNNNL